METQLWKHQKLAIQKGLELPNLALFMEMGTGKTRTVIEILRRRYAIEKRIMRTLIIAPVITLQNWKNEFKLYSKVDQRDIIILNGSSGNRVNLLMKYCLDQENYMANRVVVTNYETMQMEKVFELLLAWSPEVLICDESHRCKSHDSLRAKRVVTIADRANHKYILTGTPILNTPMDIFNQFRILDNGQSFGSNFWAFRNKYFEDENAAWNGKQGHFPKYVARPEAFADFNRLIYQKAVRAVKSECLDLPPLIKQTVYVELSKEQKRMYEEMKKEYLTFIKKNENDVPRPVLAQLAITKSLRLMQILSGFATIEDDKDATMAEIKENPRLDALSELLEDITPANKVIVWACFKANYDMIKRVCKKLKLEFAEIHGDIKDKQAEMKKFRENKDIRVMIANQQAGGIGINLVEASYSIYYSRNFSLEADLQSEARNFRGGSEMHDKITRIDLVANDTLDVVIAEALAKKLDISSRILDLRF